MYNIFCIRWNFHEKQFSKLFHERLAKTTPNQEPSRSVDFTDTFQSSQVFVQDPLPVACCHLFPPYHCSGASRPIMPPPKSLQCLGRQTVTLGSVSIPSAVFYPLCSIASAPLSLTQPSAVQAPACPTWTLSFTAAELLSPTLQPARSTPPVALALMLKQIHWK